MRTIISVLLLAFLRCVQALSSTGGRLLVVLEEASEKDLFSKFWGDLKGTRLSSQPRDVHNGIRWLI